MGLVEHHHPGHVCTICPTYCSGCPHVLNYACDDRDDTILFLPETAAKKVK